MRRAHFPVLLPLLLLPLGLSSCQLLTDANASAASQHFHLARTTIALDEAERRLDAGDSEAARREIDGIRVPSDSVRALVLRARVLIAEGRLQEAEQTILAAEASGPPSAEVALVRAGLEEARGRWSAAAAALTLATAATLDDLEPLLRLSLALQACGEHATAADLLAAELERRPGSIELLRRCAEVDLALGRYHEAAGALRAAADLGERGPALAAERALALALAGSHDEACVLAETLAPADLDDATCLALARAALATNRPARATVYLESYLDTQPGDAAAWADLAAADLLLGRDRDALAALREALGRNPGDARALVLLGHLRYRAGQHADAMGSYLEAIRLGAEAAPLAGLMETLVARLGRTEEEAVE